MSVVDEEVAARCSELLELARKDPDGFVVLEARRQELVGRLVASAGKASKQLEEADRQATRMALQVSTLIDEREDLRAVVEGAARLTAATSSFLPKTEKLIDDYAALQKDYHRLGEILEGLKAAYDEGKAKEQAERDSDSVIDRDEAGRIIGFRNVPKPLTADGSMTQAEFDRQIERLTRDVKSNGNGNGHGEAS